MLFLALLFIYFVVGAMYWYSVAEFKGTACLPTWWIVVLIIMGITLWLLTFFVRFLRKIS